jgi:hypothetical protein
MNGSVLLPLIKTTFDKDLERFPLEVIKILDENSKIGKTSDLWDGKAAMRIIDILCSL